MTKEKIPYSQLDTPAEGRKEVIKELENGEVTANMVDRLLTVEIRYGKRLDVNLIPDLYSAAREKLGGLPISLLAAKQLIENVREGDTVFLMDGFAYQPNFPYGENDGPLGIAHDFKTPSISSLKS